MKVRPITATGALAALALLGVCAPPTASAAAKAPAKPGDFNGDGRVDLAFGSPRGTVGKVQNAGFVTVVYSADPKRRQVISQNSKGIPGSAERNDAFGASLASADFDRDGYADLAVTSPGEDGGDAPLAGGRATIVYGGRKGLSTRAVNLLQPGSDGVGARQVVAGDVDGNGRPDLIVLSNAKFWVYRGLATGNRGGKLRVVGTTPGGTESNPRTNGVIADFTGDKIPDLAVSWVWQIADSDTWWTRINVYRGTRSGLSAAPIFSDKEHKAYSLAAGDFHRDGKADLAAGDIDGIPGLVRVFPGRANGLGTPQVITQDSRDVPGTAEQGDAFGASLAAADVTGDNFVDLAIGAPGDGPARGGSVTLLHGGEDYGEGLPARGRQQFTQNTPDVPGTAEAGDRFGARVSLSDVVHGFKADLIAGTPGENNGAGAAYVFRGATGGIVVKVNVFYPSTLGIAGRNPQLGSVLLP